MVPLAHPTVVHDPKLQMANSPSLEHATEPSVHLDSPLNFPSEYN